LISCIDHAPANEKIKVIATFEIWLSYKRHYNHIVIKDGCYAIVNTILDNPCRFYEYVNIIEFWMFEVLRGLPELEPDDGVKVCLLN